MGDEDEKTPLKQGLSPEGGDTERKTSTVTINVPESLQGLTQKATEGFATTQQFLAAQYVKAKEKTQKSPWILSVVIIVASVGVIWNGVFGSVSELVTLDAVTAVLKVYQTIFGLLVFALEAARYFDPLGVQGLVKSWCRLLDTALGRGLLQILPGTLAVAGFVSMGEWLPGLVLVGMGVINVFYGVYTAIVLRRVISKMRELEKEKVKSGQRMSSGDLSQIDLMAQKFQAIDVNGNGQLTKQDLRQACEELKIDLSGEDAELVFQALDRNSKGFVDVKDFEQWWFKSKASTLFV